MKLSQVFSLSVALFALVAWAGLSQAQTISMNFSFNGLDHFILGPTDVAGVMADDNWNDLQNDAGSAPDLVDGTGAATTADVSWTSSNSWGGAGLLGPPADPDHRMITAWLDDGAGLNVTVSEIPYAVYDAYIYGSSDDWAPFVNTGKALRWSVNGSTEATAGVFAYFDADPWPDGASVESDFYTGVHVDGSTGTDNPSYLRISGLVGDLSIGGFGNTSASRSPISGIQIVSATDEGRLRLNINRDTGQVDLVNNTGAAVDFTGLTMRSGIGTLLPGNWTSITDNYDQGGSVSADAWLKFVASINELTEATLGNGTLADSATVDLGTTWDKFPGEDVTMEYLDTNGDTIVGAVVFSGTTATEPYAFGDYNFDGSLDAADWPTQRDNYQADLSGMTAIEQYGMGDFDLDGDNDIDDLKAFKVAFQAANPLASLTATVPEPSTILLFALAGALVGCRRLTRTSLRADPLMALMIGLAMGGFAHAVPSIGVNFSSDPNASHQHLDPNDMAGTPGFVQGNWNNLDHLTTATDPNNLNPNGPFVVVDESGAATTAMVTWSAYGAWFDSTADPDAIARVPNAVLQAGYLDDHDGSDGGDGPQVSVTGIPYTDWDVVLYFSSDEGHPNGTHAAYDLNGNTTGDGGAILQWGESPTLDVGRNVLVLTGLSGSTLDLDGPLIDRPDQNDPNSRAHRGTLSGFQIFDAEFPTNLTLEINTDTGIGKIKNTTLGPIAFDFYEITSSPSASLTFSTWDSLEDQDFEGNGAPGTGNGWEELGSPGALGDNLLSEFYLDGDSTIDAGASISLGAIFDPNDGQQGHIGFRYNDVGSFTRMGRISIVTGMGIDGDFDGNGVVDGLDFLLWQRGGSPNPLSQSDLQDWEDNYGMVAPLSAVSSASSAVPEPTSLALLALGLTALGAGSRRLRKRTKLMHASTPVIRLTIFAVACGWLLESTAVAAVTNDRLYSFGEDALEMIGGGNHAGHTIGLHNNEGAGLLAGNTADSTGPSGAFLDMTQSGGPTYRILNGPFSYTSSSGSSTGTFGVEFDGVNDRLTGIPLNRPDELAGPTAIGDGPIVGGYPFNYDKITGRGLQMWVRPDAAALSDPNNLNFQSIVSDTVVSGGPAIDEFGNWTQINNWATPDPNDGFPHLLGTVPVVGDTFYHVMHHNFPILGNEFRSVVYVDGTAVSANIAEITAGVAGCDPFVEGCEGQLANYVGVLVVGATEVSFDGFTPAYGFHFDGVIDELEMYVFGDNTSEGGQDYGTFDLFADNEWINLEIANTVPGGVLTPGDVNKDGSVNGDGTGDPISDDVAAFVAGWGTENPVDGVNVGDWITWFDGDLDHNGVTDFADWFILLGNHPTPLSLDLSELLANVPEPTSMALAGLALTGICLGRRRFGRSR